MVASEATQRIVASHAFTMVVCASAVLGSTVVYWGVRATFLEASRTTLGVVFLVPIIGLMLGIAQLPKWIARRRAASRRWLRHVHVQEDRCPTCGADLVVKLGTEAAWSPTCGYCASRSLPALHVLARALTTETERWVDLHERASRARADLMTRQNERVEKIVAVALGLTSLALVAFAAWTIWQG
ncbi:MAG: hypothetical protein AB8I08_15350 [Sandaracinaceae bacterium]